MADVIDRDEFFRLVQEAYQKAAKKAGTHFKDIVQVVRCKDCKHISQCGVDDWFFCAEGERREEG